jgi:hypothetical protein
MGFQIIAERLIQRLKERRLVVVLSPELEAAMVSDGTPIFSLLSAYLLFLLCKILKFEIILYLLDLFL